MTTIAGRYQIRDELGQGGMASVFRAYDTTLDREVALKLMAPHLAGDASFYRRFEREAKVVATLEHPNIVPVYDYGRAEGGQPYLVMRLLRGGTLLSRLSSGSMTRQQLLAAMTQVAAALDYAHARDIVHRDIKAANIMFDDKGNAYVSDFGIAKVMDATTNLTGNSILGTAAYMSPEQFTGGDLTGRSDQYSLAVVIFEALSGRVPFVANTPHALMFQHVNEPPPDVHILDRTLPPAVSAVLRRALAKRPEERFTSVSDFVQMLAAATQSAVGASPAEEARTRQLAGYYDTGLQAYRRADWPTAVDYLGRVVSLDVGYRDAAQLHQTARYRLQEQRGYAPPTAIIGPDSGPQPAYVPGAGGAAAAPPPPRSASRWPLLVGLLLVLAAGLAAAYFLFLRDPGGEEPAAVASTSVALPTDAPAATATVAPTDTPLPTEVPPVAGKAVVVEVGTASVEIDDDAPRPLAGREELPLQAGRSVVLATSDGRAQLILPDASRLYLDEGVELSLTATAGGEPIVELRDGRMVAWSHDAPVTVRSDREATATLLGPGQMGLTLNPGAVTFEVACLQGSCEAAGPNDTAAVDLRFGQASIIDSTGFAGRPEPADAVAYAGLAGEETTIVEVTPAEAATETPAAAPSDTPTAEPPTDTPAPPATATRAAGNGTSGIGSNTTTLGAGTALDFEAFGTWVRGDQEYGTITQSSAQAHGGSRSAALEYDFPADATDDYVVFQQEHAIDGEPNLLRAWVYGDGSGHYLNVWILDAQGQTWQVPLGRVTHEGWRQMQGAIATGQAWPWQSISGPANDEVEYPIRFRGLVLDRPPGSTANQGTIYIDDLTVATGDAAAGPPSATTAPGATTAPAAGTETPTPAAGTVGDLIFSAGDSLLTADLGGQPRILGTITTNSCSAPAVAGGITYNVVSPGPGCATLGEGQAQCAAPNGQYTAMVQRSPSGSGRMLSLLPAGSSEVLFVLDRELDIDEGILWSPSSGSFLIVIDNEVWQVFTDLTYRKVISGIPGLFCPRWAAR